VGLNTASAIISFAKKLEEDSAKFYRDLAQRYVKDRDIFSSFAEENRKNVVQIERAYYGVITDAIEGCFAFDIESEAYVVETTLAEDASYSGALGKAIELEEKIGKFYADAAEQSKSYMADVPRAFMLIVKKRNNRVVKLGSLLYKEG